MTIAGLIEFFFFLIDFFSFQFYLLTLSSFGIGIQDYFFLSTFYKVIYIS